MPGLPDIPPGLEDQANQIMDDLVADIELLQVDYLANNSRYWQGLRTHEDIPENGNSHAPDKGRKPTDQDEDWNDLGVPLPAATPISLAVHTHDGPDGFGYTVEGRVIIAGQEWVKCIGVGSHSQTYDWVEVLEGI
jgi:hypothetical protein